MSSEDDRTPAKRGRRGPGARAGTEPRSPKPWLHLNQEGGGLILYQGFMVYGILTEGLLFFNHEIILENSKMKPRFFFFSDLF